MEKLQIYSGITSGRVLNGELLYTKILEVNLFAFAYRLFHEDFSSVDAAPRRSTFVSVLLHYVFQKSDYLIVCTIYFVNVIFSQLIM